MRAQLSSAVTVWFGCGSRSSKADVDVSWRASCNARRRLEKVCHVYA
jgi:hypothetical protein